jgi:hypothetical protein
MTRPFAAFFCALLLGLGAPTALAQSSEEAATSAAAGDVVPGETDQESTAPSDTASAPVAPPCPDHGLCIKNDGFSVWPKMRIRAGYTFMQADPDVLFVGANDGFSLDQARIGFAGGYRDRFAWLLTFDGVTRLPHDANDPVGPVFAATRDAYVRWMPSRFFNLWVGQVFMPSDAEGTMSRSVMAFSDRSVASEGLQAGEGFQVSGMSVGREVGLVLGARDVEMGPLLLDYRVALANGNGNNTFGNDNKYPGAYGRLGVGYGRFFNTGFSGHYNTRTVGELPNLFNESDLGLNWDLILAAFGVEFVTQIMWRNTTFDTTQADAEGAFGATTWLALDNPFGLPFFGLKPAYRLSYYDPSSLFPEDQLVENTFSVRYDAPIKLPLSFYFGYTWLVESSLRVGGGDEESGGTRELANNRLHALAQFNF